MNRSMERVRRNVDWMAFISSEDFRVVYIYKPRLLSGTVAKLNGSVEISGETV